VFARTEGRDHLDIDSWIRQRGRDDRSEDLVSFVDVALLLTRSDFPRTITLYFWGRVAWKNRNSVRRLRTGKHHIGSAHVDCSWINGGRIIRQPVVNRIIGYLFTFVLSFVIGLSVSSAVLVALAVASTRERGGSAPVRSVTRFPVLIGLPALGYAVYLNLDQFWLIWLAVVIGWTFYQSRSLLQFIRVKVPGNPLRFVPRADKLRLVRKGRWSDFATGIDKATADDPGRAEMFLRSAEPHLPARLLPSLYIARAVAAVRMGHVDEALVEMAQAVKCGTVGARSLDGWVALQSAEVLKACARDVEALAAIERAIALLSSRRDGYWVAQAMALRIRLRLQQQAPVAETVSLIHELRLQAVRRLNTAVVIQTEVWLLWLMLRAGNELGTVKLATRIARLSNGLQEYGISIDQLANRDLLLSEILLWQWRTDEARDYARDVASHAEQYSEEHPISVFYSVHPFDDDHEKTVDQLATGLAFSSLDVLRGTQQPLAEASARLIIAQALVESEPAEALAHSLAAIRTIQRVRYQLPASAWRGSWELLHLHAYHRALNLAVASQDAELTVELIESAKNQAVPLLRGERNGEQTAILDALLLSSVVVPDKTDSLPTGSDPLRFVPAVTVRGACWSAAVHDEPVPLEATLEAIAPGAWYWSGIVIAGDYFWAVRDGEGDWHAGRSTDAGLVPAVSQTLRSLPIEFIGESDNQRLHRLNGSPLYRDRHRGEEDRVEFDLLRRTADRLLPQVLQSALTAAEERAPIRLLVGLGADLVNLPVAGWPIDAYPGAPRLLERACLTHVPSIALLHTHSSSTAVRDRYPLDLAVLGPDQDQTTKRGQRLTSATIPPPNARLVRTGSLGKAQLQQLLTELAERTGAYGQGSTLFIAGHVEPSRIHEPAGGGLVLGSNARLSLRDLVTTGESKQCPAFPMPHRVILACCGSLGAERTASVHTDESTKPGDATYHSVEWLGLAAGIIAAGAEDVICTLYPIPDIEMTMRLDHELVAEIVNATDPAAALRRVQLARLQDWRAGEPIIPLLWQAYVHVAAMRWADSPGLAV
jgi:hypothetical protein